MRLRRRTARIGDKSRSDRVINRSLQDYVLDTEVDSLSAFLAFDGEPDLGPALAELSGNDVTIALPVLGTGYTMAFQCWQPETEMQINRFGIREPADGPDIKARDLDVLFIPLIAWDRQGGRLGMGGGYYDRMLETLQDHETPLRMGVAYGFQEVPRVPVEEHDIQLHGLICEHGWTLFD
jgi:5-formyltetrahydrofolate cyclo-ligase